MANKFAFILNSGNVMPAIGLGTYNEHRAKEEVAKAVIIAVKAGYRHLDCAMFYKNEKAIGKALKQLFEEGIVSRQDLFITSKLWNTCHKQELVRPSLTRTLKDLKISYVDLYLINWPFGYQESDDLIPLGADAKVLHSEIDFIDTWRSLELCVDEGLAKDIGISNFNRSQIQRILDMARIPPSNIQIECSVHLCQTKLINFCKSNNITVTAYSPLGASQNARSPYTPCMEEPLIKKLAAQKIKTPAQIIIRFMLQRGLAVVPKSITPSRIIENFQVFDFELSEDEMSDILKLNKDYRSSRCEGSCNHKYYPFNDEY